MTEVLREMTVIAQIIFFNLSVFFVIDGRSTMLDYVTDNGFTFIVNVG